MSTALLIGIVGFASAALIVIAYLAVQEIFYQIRTRRTRRAHALAAARIHRIHTIPVPEEKS